MIDYGLVRYVDGVQPSEVIPLAHGVYQEGLLTGWYRLSGGDLRGKAGKYSGRYSISRSNLLNRIDKAGYKVSCTTGPRNLQILVIGKKENNS